MMDVIFYKKPSIIGAINGMITGLVVITPAAGFVAGWGAIILGCFSGTIPWVSMNVAGKKWRLFTHHVDDCLGITHTHMVAGFLGGFLTGIFATEEGCASFGVTNPGGAIDGNGIQVGYQLAGALFIIAWNFVWTSLIMAFIKYVLRIPLRMTEEQMLIGDDAIHGEEAYCFLDDVSGVVPSEATELRALAKMDHMHADTDYKGQSILHGQDVDLEEGSSRGVHGHETQPSKESGNTTGHEIKID